MTRPFNNRQDKAEGEGRRSETPLVGRSQTPLADLMEYVRREASAYYRRNPPRGVSEEQYCAEIQLNALRIRAGSDPVAQLQIQALMAQPIAD